MTRLYGSPFSKDGQTVDVTANVPIDVQKVITQRAKSEDKDFAKLAGEFIVLGMECSRLHGAGPQGKRR